MSYATWMTLALAGGLGLVARQARQAGLPLVPVLDTALVALALGVLTARAGYVLSNWAYFAHHLDQAVRWWMGGLNWHAGFVAGLIGALAYARRARLPGPAVLDALAPGLAAGCGVGWLACYAAHCAYGLPVWPDQPLWPLAIDRPDLYGIREPRVAVQLLGAAWSAVVLGSVGWAGGRRLPAGGSAALFAALYSAGLFALGFLRADAPPQPFDAAVALLAALLFVRMIKKPDTKEFA